MDSKSLAQPASRQLRGLALYLQHRDEIQRILPHTYEVPSCTGTGTYVVRLDRGTCECPDFERHHTACKHVYAASIKASKNRRLSA